MKWCKKNRHAEWFNWCFSQNQPDCRNLDK